MSARKAKSDLVSPSLSKEVIALRREIHAHPEIKFQEKKTQALVLRELGKLGIKGKKWLTEGEIWCIVSLISFFFERKNSRALEEKGTL